MKKLAPYLKSSVENSSNLAQNGGSKFVSTQNATKPQWNGRTCQKKLYTSMWLHRMPSRDLEVTGHPKAEAECIAQSGSWRLIATLSRLPCLLFGTRKDVDYSWKTCWMCTLVTWKFSCVLPYIKLKARVKFQSVWLFIHTCGKCLCLQLPIRSLMTMTNRSCSRKNFR